MYFFYIYIYTCTDNSRYIYSYRNHKKPWYYIYTKYNIFSSILPYNAFANMSLWGLHPNMWRNWIEPCSSKLSQRRGILYRHTTDCIAIVKYKLDIVVHIFFIFGALEECNLTYTFHTNDPFSHYLLKFSQLVILHLPLYSHVLLTPSQSCTYCFYTLLPHLQKCGITLLYMCTICISTWRTRTTILAILLRYV